MIKLSKGLEPAVLTANKIAWTNELMNYINLGMKVPDGISSRYNNDEVKSALRQECRFKCMYCESVISHVAYEHIEHMKPKARGKFPELTYEWANLGLSCQICNTNKGDIYDPTLPFINPYVEDPADFIVAIGHFIYHKGGNQRGEFTKRILKLNRPELLERRQERMESITRLIDKYCKETNTSLKKAIRDEIEIEIQPDKPYSTCAKSIYSALIS